MSQGLNLNPLSHKLCLLNTSGERLVSPDESPGWRMLEWRPVLYPLPGGKVGMATATLWVHPLCRDCREMVNPPSDGTRVVGFGGDVAWQCAACFEKAGGEMKAEQGEPVPIDSGQGSPVEDVPGFGKCHRCGNCIGLPRPDTNHLFCNNCYDELGALA